MSAAWRPSRISALIVCSLLVACGDPNGRPDDVPGTVATALQLALGADGRLRTGLYTGISVGVRDVEDGPVVEVEVCLNPSGVCIPADYRYDECYRYDDIQAFVDGVELRRTWPGGWSSAPMFEPLPSGGSGYGCSFPEFETVEIQPSAGQHDITFVVGGKTVPVVTTNDWLVMRTLSIPNNELIRGVDVLVEVTPNVSPAIQNHSHLPSTSMYYDDSDANFEWCLANAFGDTSSIEYCSSSRIGAIEPDAWRENGFIFRAPHNLPLSVGEFTMGEFLAPAEVLTCPFALCDVRGNRGATAEGIRVVDP